MNQNTLALFQSNIQAAIQASATNNDSSQVAPAARIEAPLVLARAPVFRRNYCRLTEDQMRVVIAMRTEGKSYEQIKLFCTRTWINANVSVAGLAAAVVRVNERGNFDRVHRGGRPRQLEPAVRDHIVELQLTHPQWTYQQITNATEHNFQQTVSRSNVARVLKDTDFTTKQLNIVPEARNSAENVRARRTYALRAMLWRDDDVFFIDEAGFHLGMHRGRGRAPRGNPAIETVSYIKSKNTTVLACISPTRGLVQYQIIEGSANSAIYAEFVTKLLARPEFNEAMIPDANNFTQSADEMGSSVPVHIQARIVIQDGARIHKTPLVQAAYENTNHINIILPPYSPHLNPIELCFSKLKAPIKRVYKPTQAVLTQLIHDAAKTITSSNTSGWYQHAKGYYAACANEEPLEDVTF